MSTQVPPSRLDSTKDFSSLVPSAFAQANAAFAAANNSTDTWVRTQANNAYDTANAAFVQANNSTDTWVRTQANNAFLKANASYVAQNTTASFANGAFDRANSAASFANSAFLVANSAYAWGNHATVGYATTTYVGTAISNLVNSAPTTLDTLNELATALGNDANFSTTITNMVGTANSFANGAFDRANAAYAQANTGSTDTWVRGQANSAFNAANSGASFANAAYATANAAFAAANTGGGGTTAAYVKTYYWKGALTENVGTLRHYIPLITANVTSITSYLASPGLTQSTAVVKKNGTVINTIRFAAAGTSNTQTGLSIPVTSSDYLTVDITQSSSGSDLYINFIYQG